MGSHQDFLNYSALLHFALSLLLIFLLIILTTDENIILEHCLALIFLIFTLITDEHSIGTLSRNRLAVSVCDHEASRASSSSFQRSSSSNGSMGLDKDSYAQSRAYSSFVRSHRDRDRDRQRDREKDNLLDNGYCDYADLLMTRRTDKDTLRRSQSMVSGRRVELVAKRPGSDSSNSIPSAGSLSSGLSKVSFERDFPSLGAEEKLGVSDVGRVSSPGISTAINSLHISTSAVIGADGWTSALAEVPALGVGNGPSMSSGLQTAANISSTASSATTGLSMAETLAQAPSRARTAPPVLWQKFNLFYFYSRKCLFTQVLSDCFYSYPMRTKGVRSRLLCNNTTS